MSAAYPINLGTTYQSYISTINDVDYYKVNIASSEEPLDITLLDAPYDYNLKLYDSTGYMVADSNTFGPGGEGMFFDKCNPGEYYIEICPYWGFSSTKNYSFIVTIPVLSVSLDKYSASINVGQSLKLTATVYPENATNKEVSWSSSNTSVAAVDQTGNVTAVGEGTAKIMVSTSNGGHQAACTVTTLGGEKPVISGAANKTITIGNSFDPLSGITAADNEDGNLTPKLVISGNVDTGKVGNYVLTYSVTDSSMNTTTRSITITVVPMDVQVVPLIGTSRYDTAVKLSQSQFTSADTVIIVNGGAMADGLGATPLAKHKNAPLLLTEAKSLPDVTVNEIKGLNPTNAIIVGGTGVVSDNVKKQLESLGLTVGRISGTDRYGTSLEVAKYIDSNCYDVSRIVVSSGNGEADALSIASVAGRDDMPIILTAKDTIPTATYDWLESEDLQDAYIIGGSGVVSDNILNKIDAITSNDISGNRLGGSNRFETNSQVIEKFYGNIIDKTYIAKGYQLIDALAAGPVAALNGSPVVLSGIDLSDSQKAVLGSRSGNTIIRTGGGISDTAVNSLKECLK